MQHHLLWTEIQESNMITLPLNQEVGTLKTTLKVPPLQQWYLLDNLYYQQLLEFDEDPAKYAKNGASAQNF